MSYSKNEKIDAILIPGGGITEDGEPQPWVRARLDRAAEVYKLTGGVMLMPLSGGTTHKPPPVGGDGFPIYEANASARYLMNVYGIPAEYIMLENNSYDTIGNAAFARWMLTDPNPELNNLLVITSEFHMPRTKAIFDWVFSLPSGRDRYTLDFESVPNVGLNDDALQARRAKEVKGLEVVKAQARELTTMSQFQHWLFTEHAAYSAKRLLKSQEQPKITATTLESY